MEVKRVGAGGFAALALAVGLAGLGSAAQARVPKRVEVADLSCGSQNEPQLYALGRLAEAGASPVAVPIVNDFGGKRLRNAELASFTVGESLSGGWRADEAIRELARAAGRRIDVVSPRGMLFPIVDMPVKGMSLDKALDSVAAASSLSWGFDGKVIRVAPRNEWSFALPKDRDLALAVIEAVRRFVPASVSVEGGALHLVGDEARATQVAGIISSVFAQPRINPFDVTWYKVWPTRGEINWSGMPLRTDVVRDSSFSGRGASMVLKDTSQTAIEAFLAGEGEVQPMGTATMVSPVMNGDVSRVAGCGVMIDAGRGLTAAARGDFAGDGSFEIRFALTGRPGDTAGSVQVTGGEAVVVASGAPVSGSFVVAVIRPRAVEIAPHAPLLPLRLSFRD